jgi:hypothetical protein
MKTSEHTNEHGIRVTEHICETCGVYFSLTPGSDDWPDCLGDDCASYDPDREIDVDELKLPTGPRRIIH